MKVLDSNKNPIDFVITWVDDKDPLWKKKKSEYSSENQEAANNVERYRDWDMLKYWFRGVEKFAPWVRYVFFVTDNQKPEWLNSEHPKLKWVKHTDYIPSQYLPTFSSHTIEWNFDKIEELSENFVYFNDDVFLINNTKPSDFFVDDKPCDLLHLGPLYPEDSFSYILFNNMCLINKYFSLRKFILENPLKAIKSQSLGGIFKLIIYGRRAPIPNSIGNHIHFPLKKSTFKTLWEKEYEKIDSTCLNKFRNKEDISINCVRDWQIFSNEYHPKKAMGKCFHTATMDHGNEAINHLKSRKDKIICLNDTENELNFQIHKQMIVDEFEKIFPDKSAFEL